VWVIGISSTDTKENSQSDYYYAKYDAIPHEERKAVPVQVPKEKSYDQDSDQTTHEDSDDVRKAHSWWNAAFLVKMQSAFRSGRGRRWCG
jgi:hypothetical protein